MSRCCRLRSRGEAVGGVLQAATADRALKDSAGRAGRGGESGVGARARGSFSPREGREREAARAARVGPRGTPPPDEAGLGGHRARARARAGASADVPPRPAEPRGLERARAGHARTAKGAPAGGVRKWVRVEETGNDPSAGSPTETLLRLLLPLNDKVWTASRDITAGEPAALSQSGGLTGPFNR